MNARRSLTPVLLFATSLLHACGNAPERATPDAVPAPVVVDDGLDVPAVLATRPYADTLHGVVVPDPLRWIEDTTNADVQTWVATQRRYTDSLLARLVGIDSLTATVERAYQATPTLDAVLRTPSRLIVTRWLGAMPSMFALDTGSTSEREILSATTLARVRNGAELRGLSPSWDGDLVAIGTTEQGDANATVSVVDARTGRLLADRVPDLLTTTSGTRYEVTWLPDGSGFFYPRRWPNGPNAQRADELARGRQFLHLLGTPQSSDVAVFGFGVSSDVPIDKVDLPTRVYTAPNSVWLVGSIFRSKQNATDFFAAPLTLPMTKAPAWFRIGDLSDRLTTPQLRGDTVYAISRRGADRGAIVRRVLSRTAMPDASAGSSWETVAAERAGVITAFSVQSDALYFTERVGGTLTLLRQPHGARDAVAVSLPVQGTIRLQRNALDMPGIMFSVESWATPPDWYQVDAAGKAALISIDDGSAQRTGGRIVAERLEAPSKDGTLVPVSLVYGDAALRNGVLDGTAPLLIDAYGGFGVSSDARFDPSAQVWVELGGVFAYAHVRGGGELGDAWHMAATRENKQRSIDDMIGAIEALIAKRYTSAGRVTMVGISFGANIPGLTMLQRPDLLGAVLYEVGQPDEIRGSAFDPTAARNIGEIGDLDTPEGIRALMKSSPYHQVPDRVSLPAVFVHSASDDYNFGADMLVGKFVARLQAANSGTRPVAWVRTPGGHRQLIGLSPQWTARAMSFALWQTGLARFQPAPRAGVPRPGATR